MKISIKKIWNEGFSSVNKVVPKWYQQCYNLPMDRFIRMLENWDLNELIIQGQPSREDLLSAKTTIMADYRKNIESSEKLYLWQLENDIREIQAILKKDDSLVAGEQVKYKNLVRSKQKALEDFKKANIDLNFTAEYFEKLTDRIFDYGSGRQVRVEDISVSQFVAGFYVFTEDLEEYSEKNHFVW